MSLGFAGSNGGVGLKLEEPVLVDVRVLIVVSERNLTAHLEVAARRVEVQRVRHRDSA